MLCSVSAYKLPPEDLSYAAFWAVGRAFCRLKAHALIEPTRWAPGGIIRAKGDQGQRCGWLDQGKAVRHKRLGDPSATPALAHGQPVDFVVRCVSSGEQERAHEWCARNIRPLANTKGHLPLDAPSKRPMKAWIVHHWAKQKFDLCGKVEPGGNIGGLCQSYLHRRFVWNSQQSQTLGYIAENPRITYSTLL